ncbi:MAG: hypothetical protein WCA35_12160 [Kovacikia sp.]
MNTDELTQIVTAHQSVVARHDQEMAEIRLILAEIARSQAQTQAQQALNTEAIANISSQQTLNAQAIALNREDIAQLTANIEGLRNQVSDYIAGRERQ